MTTYRFKVTITHLTTTDSNHVSNQMYALQYKRICFSPFFLVSYALHNSSFEVDVSKRISSVKYLMIDLGFLNSLQSTQLVFKWIPCQYIKLYFSGIRAKKLSQETMVALDDSISFKPDLYNFIYWRELTKIKKSLLTSTSKMASSIFKK